MAGLRKLTLTLVSHRKCSAIVGERMNTRMVFGIILLIIAAVYFYIVPFRSVSSTGTEIIYWANIVPGIILAILGIALLATGLRSKKQSA